MNDVYLHGYCRVCKGPWQEVLNLGHLRLNAFPQHPWEVDLTPRVHLILAVCTECGLAQLDRTVPPDWLYRRYWYRSGVNEMMVRELQGIVEEAVLRCPVGSGDRVLDIGANDGTLLAHYQTIGRAPHRFAVEPALNLHAALQPHTDVLIGGYFPNADLIESYREKFRIVTAIAMCYDLEDPVGFFQGIRDLLEPDGLAVVQFQDFAQQLDTAAFDNICHEHLEYYTLWSLAQIVRRAGLTIQDVQLTPINGGSLRVFLRRTIDHPTISIAVACQLSHETSRGLDTPTIRSGNLGAFALFRERVEAAKARIGATLGAAQQAGSVIDVYGASTKGNILLQVMGVGPGQVRQAIDRSPEKHGYHTITGIPIVGEEEGRREPADLWLVPIWQFRESVLRREGWYLEQGGTILFPLPGGEIVRRWPVGIEVE